MMYLVETDQMAIYISYDQALFVLSSTQSCPRCGRTSRLFLYRNGHTECVGCNGPKSTEEKEDIRIVLPVYGG
jgi:ssDNA-binding Zn-finger/Zn-ribbon topoisomerase 1